MEYRTLPGSTLHVSAICLGTMTFGQQNSEAEGHAQLDYAFARGVNFIDTAEMYRCRRAPTPCTPPSGLSAAGWPARTATKWCWPPKPLAPAGFAMDS